MQIKMTIEVVMESQEDWSNIRETIEDRLGDLRSDGTATITEAKIVLEKNELEIELMEL